RLLAIGAVVVDQCDLLALELVGAAELLGDVLDGDVGRGPVAAHRNEIPCEDRAVTAVGAAVARRQQGNFVARHLLGEGEGDAGRERREIAGTRRALALEALVAFDALVRGVAGLALLVDDPDPVDAAVALVNERPVVGNSVSEWDAIWRIRAGAVDQ